MLSLTVKTLSKNLIFGKFIINPPIVLIIFFPTTTFRFVSTIFSCNDINVPPKGTLTLITDLIYLLLHSYDFVNKKLDDFI